MFKFVRNPSASLTLGRRSALLSISLITVAAIAACGGGDGDQPTVIQEFSATPNTIQPGQTTTLSWKAAGATNLAVSGITATPDSSAVVSPNATTTYRLTATLPNGGTFSKDVTVTVSSANQVATAAIDPSQAGDRIPRSFIGFSHEWGQGQLLMGNPKYGNVNAPYRQLIANLAAYGGGPVSIRIGGNSTDDTTHPDADTVPPFAQFYTDMAARQRPVSFIVGVNLKANDTALATEQATAYVQGMPAGAVEAVEIGNEPDLFPYTGGRPQTYNFTQYLADFDRFKTAIQAALPNGPLLMGPSIARYPGTINSKRLPASNFGTTQDMQAFLTQEVSSLALISAHCYVTAGINAGNTINPGFLLAPSSTERVALAAPYVALAKAAGKSYRMAEINSLSSSGQDGISNAFEATLWSTDLMFEYAKVGASGVNFHGNNWNSFKQWDAYSPFHFNVPESQFKSSKAIAPPPDTTFSSEYQIREVQSLYYGMLLFAEATSHSAKMIPVSAQTSANLKVWATLDDTDGKIRVVVLNKDQAAAGTISLSVPGYASAVATRVLAPTFSSKTGITIGGQTFDGSSDGKPVGVRYGELVSPVDGKFNVSIGAASAFLLTLTK